MEPEAIIMNESIKLFDSHCHLQDERIAKNLDQIMHRAKLSGVSAFLCCGSCEEDWPDVETVSKKFPGVYPAYGIHPWYINEKSRNWLDILENYISSTNAAVGEIGLDHAIEAQNFEEQAEIFRLQIRLANKYKRPVSLHCRKAWQKMTEILTEEGGLVSGGAIHSYSGSAEFIPVLEKLGCFISFSCSVTRSGNKRARKACPAVSEDRLLIETDTPDIPPLGDNPLNEPSNMRLVLKTVSELRKRSEQDIAEITFENAMRLFGKK